MGVFSWKCAVSKKSIPNNMLGLDPEHSNVILVTPDNRKLHGSYDGYGRLEVEGNSYDIFEEVMKPNPPTDRYGNHLASAPFFDSYDEAMKRVKLVLYSEYTGQSYEELDTSENCEYQGHFYDEDYIKEHFPYSRPVHKKSINFAPGLLNYF